MIDALLNIGGKLVDKLEDVMNVSRNEPNKEFIRRVLKDFNYFTQKM